MSAKAKALANLYRRKKITEAGLKQAVEDGIITADAFKEITEGVFDR